MTSLHPGISSSAQIRLESARRLTTRCKKFIDNRLSHAQMAIRRSDNAEANEYFVTRWLEQRLLAPVPEDVAQALSQSDASRVRPAPGLAGVVLVRAPADLIG